MDKAERIELLRRRFRAMGGIPWAGKGTAKPKAPERNPPCNQLGLLVNRTFEQWVTRPDEVQVETVRHKRTKRPSPLTRIAERWAAPTWRSETKRLDLHHACR